MGIGAGTRLAQNEDGNERGGKSAWRRCTWCLSTARYVIWAAAARKVRASLRPAETPFRRLSSSKEEWVSEERTADWVVAVSMVRKKSEMESSREMTCEE